MTSKLALQWLPCQAPGVIRSALCQYTVTGWGRKFDLELLSPWQQVKISEQIHPWDTLACCWDVQQPTNNKLQRSLHFMIVRSSCNSTVAHEHLFIIIIIIMYPTHYHDYIITFIITGSRNNVIIIGSSDILSYISRSLADRWGTTVDFTASSTPHGSQLSIVWYSIQGQSTLWCCLPIVSSVCLFVSLLELFPVR